MKLLILTFLVICSIHAQADNPQNDHAVEWVLVRFQRGQAPADIPSKGHPDLKRMPVLPGETAEEAVSRYSEFSEVIYAELDLIAEVGAVPSDTYFSSQYGMNLISAPVAWDKFTGTVSTKICIIDTGVDRNHPDLVGNVAVGFNAITGVADGMDDHGHGTHCAGVIGAKGNNAQGVAGINWDVTIIPCKFLSSSGSGFMSDAVECMYYCRDQGATISSNSWSTGYSQSVYDAMVDLGSTSDHLFMVAAGNAGIDQDNSTSPAYPAAFNLPYQITVAASGTTDALASYSNYGNVSVHLTAPGNNIYSTILAGSYGYKSGTSMATPHVAGAAALLRAGNPSLTSAAIKSALLNNVDVLNNLSGYVSTSGRLNVAKALESIVLDPTAPSSTPTPTPSPSPVPSPPPKTKGKPRLRRLLA